MYTPNQDLLTGHIFEIPDNSLGWKRKFHVDSFTFNLKKKAFIIEGETVHYEADGTTIMNMVAIRNIPDKFVGDTKIMVSLEPGSEGVILNPGREDVRTLNLPKDVLTGDLEMNYTSQYEYTYDIYNSVIKPLFLFLFSSYPNWKD